MDEQETLDNETREGDEQTELLEQLSIEQLLIEQLLIEQLLIEELLIEEISIDGMCGVY
jgi:mycofactocin precursor